MTVFKVTYLPGHTHSGKSVFEGLYLLVFTQVSSKQKLAKGSKEVCTYWFLHRYQAKTSI